MNTKIQRPGTQVDVIQRFVLFCIEQELPVSEGYQTCKDAMTEEQGAEWAQIQADMDIWDEEPVYTVDLHEDAREDVLNGTHPLWYVEEEDE